MVATPVRRTRRAKETTTTRDPRTVRGALVRVPNGDRAYVEGIDPQDPSRVTIQYEARFKYGNDPYDRYPVHLLTLVKESPEPPPDEDVAIAPAPSSPLDTLAEEISELYGQLEEAEEVALSAAKSALTFAREMGEKLLQAKQECGHGNWENWRKQLVSPRSGKTMPSSTATLYQRIAKRWEEVEQAQTLREAAALLKGDRKSTTVAESANESQFQPQPQSKEGSTGTTGASHSQSRSDAGRTSSSVGTRQGSNPQPALVAAEAELGEGDAQTEGQPVESSGLEVYRSSITPEEFAREMAPKFTGCHLCKYRVLTDQGDRYWCEQGEFDDTLLLKQNWMEMNEGCKNFTQPAAQSKPTYSVPDGVLRLEDVEGGTELHGLVLSQERYAKLAALARTLDGTLSTALFQLIDQLPEVQ